MRHMRHITRLISNDEKLTEMNKIVQAFDLNQKIRNTIFQLENTVLAAGKSFDDFLYYIRELNKLIKADRIKRETAIKKITTIMRQDCPDCDKLMRLAPVNTSPADQTGDPADKSVWVCENKDCMEVIFNTETIDIIIKRRGGT